MTKNKFSLFLSALFLSLSSGFVSLPAQAATLKCITPIGDIRACYISNGKEKYTAPSGTNSCIVGTCKLR